jgi:hypothetical protein
LQLNLKQVLPPGHTAKNYGIAGYAGLVCVTGSILSEGFCMEDKVSPVLLQ